MAIAKISSQVQELLTLTPTSRGKSVVTGHVAYSVPPNRNASMDSPRYRRSFTAIHSQCGGMDGFNSRPDRLGAAPSKPFDTKPYIGGRGPGAQRHSHADALRAVKAFRKLTWHDLPCLARRPGLAWIVDIRHPLHHLHRIGLPETVRIQAVRFGQTPPTSWYPNSGSIVLLHRMHGPDAPGGPHVRRCQRFQDCFGPLRVGHFEEHREDQIAGHVMMPHAFVIQVQEIQARSFRYQERIDGILECISGGSRTDPRLRCGRGVGQLCLSAATHGSTRRSPR